MKYNDYRLKINDCAMHRFEMVVTVQTVAGDRVGGLAVEAVVVGAAATAAASIIVARLSEDKWTELVTALEVARIFPCSVLLIAN